MIRRDFFTAHNILSNSITISGSAWNLEQFIQNDVMRTPDRVIEDEEDEENILIPMTSEEKAVYISQSKVNLLNECNQVKVIEEAIKTELPDIDECFSFMGFSKTDAFSDVNTVQGILEKEEIIQSLINYKAKITKALPLIPFETNNTYILHDIIEAMGLELRGLNCHNGQPLKPVIDLEVPANNKSLEEVIIESVVLRLPAARTHLKKSLDKDDQTQMGALVDYIDSHYQDNLLATGEYIEANHPPLIMVRRAWLWQ